MKESNNESNFSQNEYTNESDNKNKIQKSANKVPYQKLFSENNTFNKKLLTKKCTVNKKSCIIFIILSSTILFIISILYIFYFSVGTKKSFSKQSFSSRDFINNGITNNINYYLGSDSIKNIGFSTGGAKDINNFRQNIKNGYFPISTDITYNGLFYDYYFDTGKNTKSKSEHLFSPSYSYAISKDPISLKNDYYITVGLNSNIKESDFQRKKLNLIIVLDISGSMSSPFSSYYYDYFLNENKNKTQTEEDKKSKMEIANESVNILIDQLKSYDRLGIVLFNNKAEILKKIELISETNIEKTKKVISQIEANGGTNLEEGYTKASKLLEKYINSNKLEYENRIILITDAMPNYGTTSPNNLLSYIKGNANQSIYTTFIGVGVDFNTELIEAINDVKGANYYSVHNSKEFKERMGEQFEYMVTPLVFDLRLNLKSDDYNIEMVYGSDTSNKQKENLMKVNTLFPSKTSEEGEVKGGVVLVKLKAKTEKNNGKINLEVFYKDRNGKEYNNSQTINFDKSKNEEFYDNSGIRKAIVLSRYANILKNWILYERTENKVFIIDGSRGIVDLFYTEEEITKLLGEHERTSVNLKVGNEYKEIFKHIKEYILKENNEIKDDTLNKEIEILDLLINKE